MNREVRTLPLGNSSTERGIIPTNGRPDAVDSDLLALAELEVRVYFT